ncbi:MAG: AmmeMemoRadiSam system protein B [Verrucomicrobiota bacterium]
MKRMCSLAVAALLLAGLSVSCGYSAEDGPVRLPAVAGQFYPASPGELSRMIDSMLGQAALPKIEGRIRALIVPHAGYIYSGPVAAYGFKAVAGQPYKTVVLIGNSHREGFEGASVYPRGKFKTPLGDVEIDSALAQKLMDSDPRIYFRESAHIPEHSLEVEIPFLQKTLGQFKIVPILLGTESTEIARVLGEALAKSAAEDTLVVTSSDMSHYPKYEDARFADNKVIESICTGSEDNYDRMLRQLERTGIPHADTFMCGEGATKAVMFFAGKVGASRIQLLKYGNSGDTAGSKDSVVGYCAIAFSDSGAFEKKAEGSASAAKDEVLNKAEEKALLDLAKLAVETYVRTGAMPAWTNTLPGLEQPLGAFVTLKEGGDLRGCIGRFQPDIPLWRVVMQMGVAAATQDARFPQVRTGELDKLEYEISVLSPLRKVGSWKEIELGRHGVEVVRGFRHGVFLPQVATETGWDLDTFMSQLCAQKAGLPQDAWKDPATELYVFTAQVFGDKAE